MGEKYSTLNMDLRDACNAASWVEGSEQREGLEFYTLDTIGKNPLGLWY